MRRLVGCLLVALAGCATYDERIESVHRSFYAGRTGEAIEKLEDELGEREEDRSLVRLELASALQAQGRYKQAAWHLAELHESLEVMDYSRNTLADVADFVFAARTQTYKASRLERVMLNTQNLLNFLGAGDLAGAEVEARRVVQLMLQEDLDDEELFANAFAWGLAALVLERSGDFEESEDAYRAADGSPLENREWAAGQEATEGAEPGVILVVAQTGQVPIRMESIYLLPVGARVHRLNLPTLVDRPRRVDSVHVELDDVAQGELPVLLDFAGHTRRRYDQEFPLLLAAAATQVIPRTMTAEMVRIGVRENLRGDSGDDDAAEALADIAAFIVEWLLAEVAGSDTRCWSLLPAEMRAARLNVAPGRHRVEVVLDGQRRRTLRHDVEVGPGEIVLVNVLSSVHEGFHELPSPRERDMKNQPEGEAALAALEEALHLKTAF